MPPETEHAALAGLLAQMREIYEELLDYNAGICVLHLEAAIAALESHLRREGVTVEVKASPRLKLVRTDG